MCELLWGKKTNQSSIQNAHMKRVIEEDGWYCFRNAVAMMLLIFCLHPSISFAANPAKISAVTSDNITFNIPQQRADTALTQFAEQANLTLVFPFEDVKEKTANRLVGDYPIAQAAQLLLENTGLTPTFSNQLVLNIEIEAKGKRNMKTQINQRKHLLATFIAVFGAGAVSSGVMAQDGSEAAAGQRQLEEVVVTAQKREQSIMDVPISITVLSGAQLAENGIDNIHDLAYLVPDLSVSQRSPGRTNIIMRGVGNVRGSSSLVGIYLDEAAVSGQPALQIDLQVVDLERVEVLKGPQGTLYGESAAGGVIKFITKDPELDHFGGEVDVSFSGTRDGGFNHRVTAVTNVPIVEDVFGLRFSGTYDNSDGWVDVPTASRENINDNNLVNAKVKALWRPVDALEVKGTIIVHRNEGGGGNAVFSAQKEDSNAVISVDRLAEIPFSDDYEFYNLTANYDFGFANLLSATSYSEQDKSYIEGTAFLTSGSELFAPATVAIEIFTQEIRLASSSDGPINWTTGFFYRDYNAPIMAVNQVLRTSGTLLNFPSDRTVTSESWAVFGDVSYALTERLEIGLGVRHFQDDRTVDDQVRGTFQKGGFNAVTPRIYLSYGVADDIKLYGSVSEGFRSGGFNSAAAAASGLSETFGPEEVITYEVGTKTILFNGRLAAEIAFFFSDYTGIQSAEVQEAATVTANVGDGEIQGIDWSFTLNPVESWTIGLAGNVVNAEVVALSSGVRTHVAGDPLDRVPDYSYMFSARYDFDWANKGPGFIRLGYNVQGPSTITNRPSAPQASSDTVRFLEASYGVMLNNWDFEVFGRNLLDDRGIIIASQTEQNAQARPRTIGLKVGRSW